jgi:hypothetical protein
MADDTTSAARKNYSRPYDDPLNPPDRSEINKKVSEKQRRLWQALHSRCQEHGAWVVSVPGHRELRIECRKDSTLPSKLKELGYEPRCCETHTRIEAGHFLPVDVISILLPGK